MKSILKLSVMLLIGVFVMNSCKTKKDIVSPASVNPSNGNSVSKSIDVKGATRKSGNPPPSSNTFEAPMLLNDNNTTIPALSGRSIIISPLASGAVVGAFLKIQGSDDYFDVPFNYNLKKGTKSTRLSKVKEDNGSIQIDLPSNIGVGTFCVDYCVYDANFYVSNIITVCVTVSQIGGANSEFLHGTWKIVKEVYQGDEFYFDQIENYNDTAYISCDDFSMQDYPVTESYLYSQVDFTFGSNGGLEYVGAFSGSFVDYTNSNCTTGIVYENISESYKFLGGWSYNDETKKVILLFDVTEYGDEEPFAWEFTLKSKTDNTLVLQEVFDPSYEIHFQKK